MQIQLNKMTDTLSSSYWLCRHHTITWPSSKPLNSTTNSSSLGYTKRHIRPQKLETEHQRRQNTKTITKADYREEIPASWFYHFQFPFNEHYLQLFSVQLGLPLVIIASGFARPSTYGNLIDSFSTEVHAENAKVQFPHCSKISIYLLG